MILNWTSSVNINTLPSVGTFQRKDVMKYHIWNLYSNLTASGWTPISSSYSNGASIWQLSSSWNSATCIEFPLSMSVESQETIITGSTDIYTPTPHSWVTLQRPSGLNDGEYYYLTIDCRYPLPPHLSSVSVVYERTKGNDQIDKILLSTERNDIFIGSSAIEKKKGITVFNGIDSDGDGIEDEQANRAGYLNEQRVDVFKGVCFNDNSTQEFSMEQGQILKGQDYISRCVSFVDIVFHKGQSDLLKHNDDLIYKSATISVRPKVGATDDKFWYVCWGFDYMEKNPNNNSIKIDDFVDVNDYKYAFHKTGISSTEFIFQIYNLKSERFTSGIGFLPVNNRVSGDSVSHSSLCINCNPSFDYGNKSICYNSTGNKLSLVQVGIDSFNFNHSNDQINNFFNTCYRNYNFSDGINNYRAGNSGKFTDSANMPIYAPVSASDSTIFCENLSFPSCSYINIPGQSISIGGTGVENLQTHYGPTTNRIKLKRSITESNYVYFKNSEYKYKVVPKYNATNKYKVFFYRGDKKVLAFQGGNLIEKMASDIRETYTGTRQAFSRNFIKRLSFSDTNSTLANTHIKNYSKFLELFDEETFSNVENKKIILYVGQIALREPTASTLFVNAAKAAPVTPSIKSPQIKPTILNIVKNELMNGDEGVQISTPEQIFQTYTDYIMPNYTVKKTKTGVILSPFTSTSPVPLTLLYNAENPGNLEDCFIEVPISDVYDNYIEQSNTNLIPQIGNFAYGADINQPAKNQKKGVNYFSVFKSLGRKTNNEYYEETLSAALYTFSKNKDSVSDKSILGVCNKTESESNETYLTDKDEFKTYSELPIFLFSTSADSGKFKGYVPDITFAPSEIKEASLVQDPNNPGKFTKIFWSGCWFPWVTDQQPDF